MPAMMYAGLILIISKIRGICHSLTKLTIRALFDILYGSEKRGKSIYEKEKHIRMLLMTALLLSCTACGFFGKEETPTAPEKEAVKQEEKQKTGNTCKPMRRRCASNKSKNRRKE